ANYVPARPVSTEELAVIERLRRASRVLEAGIEPVLAEQPEKVDAADRAHGGAFRQQVRRQEVADAAARAALSARVVPVELPIEPQVTAREVIAIEIAKSKVAVDAEEVVRPFLRMLGRIVAEAWIEERLEVLAGR